MVIVCGCSFPGVSMSMLAGPGFSRMYFLTSSGLRANLTLTAGLPIPNVVICRARRIVSTICGISCGVCRFQA